VSIRKLIFSKYSQSYYQRLFNQKLSSPSTRLKSLCSGGHDLLNELATWLLTLRPTLEVNEWLSGNIPDVKDIKNLFTELDFLGHKKPKLVTNKVFFSKENIEDMFKERIKFLLSAKTSVKLVTEQIEKVYSVIQKVQYYNNSYQLYSMTIPAMWEIGRQKKCKNGVSSKKHRVYAHVYYDIMRMAEKQN